MLRLENSAKLVSENKGILCCVIFAVYVTILAVMDIKSRKLPLAVLLSGFLFIPAGAVWGGAGSPVFSAAGAAVGAVFLGVSKVTDEGFGYGDSLLIMIMGGFLGFWKILSLLTWAFTMAAVFALILLVRNHFHRKDSFPFVPFLAAAYIGGAAVGIY